MSLPAFSGTPGIVSYPLPFSVAITKGTTNTATPITANGVALASNPNRKELNIQNIGTVAVNVYFGTGASNSVRTFVLAPDTATAAGYGGQLNDKVYTGVVTVFAVTGTPNLLVAEVS